MLDFFWLKGDGSDEPDSLRPPDEIAAQIGESFQGALEAFRAVADEFGRTAT